MSAKFFFIRRFNYIDALGLWMFFSLLTAKSLWAVPVLFVYAAASFIGEQVTGVNK